MILVELEKYMSYFYLKSLMEETLTSALLLIKIDRNLLMLLLLLLSV
jgi:hypothetical protein